MEREESSSVHQHGAYQRTRSCRLSHAVAFTEKHAKPFDPRLFESGNSIEEHMESSSKAATAPLDAKK